MDIKIDQELKTAVPETVLAVLFYEADVKESSAEFNQAFQQLEENLKKQYTLETIVENPHVLSTRTAYKKLGNKPTEHRNAAEAMLRRIVKGQGLYHINSIVDINNYISVSSGYSIGSYDLDQLKEPVEYIKAPEGTFYEGIGKGGLNLVNMPVLKDENGAFGNASSDSRRAMITEGHHRIMSIIYSFDGAADTVQWTDQFAAMLKQYAGAAEVEVKTF
jgi:DNA/RNA-binding domain of Phe-tRNA-synthetase-like protein